MSNMETVRQVDAVKTGMPLFFYDTKSERRPLGQVSIERFDNNSVATYSFSPDSENGMTGHKRSRSTYRLGVGSGKLDMIDPAEVQKLFLDQGWEIEKQVHTRGGAGLRTIFSNDRVVWDDVINYDYKLWPNRPQAPLRHSVMVEANINISYMALRVVEGLYRKVCTNGMYSLLLNLGSYSAKHIRQVSNPYETIIQDMAVPDELPGQDVQMNKTNLAQVIYYLDRSYNRLLESGSEYTKKNSLKLTQLAPFRPCTMNKGMFFAFMEATKAILDKPGDDVTSLDLINAYTNGINLSNGTPTDVWNAYGMVDTTLSSIIQLANFTEFFDGSYHPTPIEPDLPEPVLVSDGPEDTYSDDLDDDTWNLDSYLSSVK